MSRLDPSIGFDQKVRKATPEKQHWSFVLMQSCRKQCDMTCWKTSKYLVKTVRVKGRVSGAGILTWERPFPPFLWKTWRKTHDNMLANITKHQLIRYIYDTVQTQSTPQQRWHKIQVLMGSSRATFSIWWVFLHTFHTYLQQSTRPALHFTSAFLVIHPPSFPSADNGELRTPLAGLPLWSL